MDAHRTPFERCQHLCNSQGSLQRGNPTENILGALWHESSRGVRAEAIRCSQLFLGCQGLPAPELRRGQGDPAAGAGEPILYRLKLPWRRPAVRCTSQEEALHPAAMGLRPMLCSPFRTHLSLGTLRALHPQLTPSTLFNTGDEKSS